MPKTYASIDVGSHTARLLVARGSGSSAALRPLARKRAYIRLAEKWHHGGAKIIGSAGIARVVSALEDFSRLIEAFNVQSVHAVATGVIRDSDNWDEVLSSIYENTGIAVRPITGSEEALLTAKGVLSALNIQAGSYLIFDLGGGSTEFLFGGTDPPLIRSIPLGALILTGMYLKSDPPAKEEIENLSGSIDETLRHALGLGAWAEPLTVAGTGGTVTTLGAMIHGIPAKDISSNRINGLILEGRRLKALFLELRNLSLEERARLPGLDRERADVILAGVVAVIGILDFFKSHKLTVSLSDLLEGILIEQLGISIVQPEV